MDLTVLVEQAVEGLGYELVDLEKASRGLLRVFIDTPKGIGVEDCARVSNYLTRLFIGEQVDYQRLEVSSPGLDRPLRQLKHFERFIGTKISLRTRIPQGANQRNFIGTLLAVEGSLIVLKTDQDALKFEWSELDRAHLIPDL